MAMLGMPAKALPAFFLGAVLCACAGQGDTEASAGPTVRDSAGIRVVTYPAGPFNDTVSAEPLLTIGREGDPAYEFFRLNTVVALGSGTIVAANGGTHELRFYDAGGSHIRSVGGSGEGPAEFGFLSTVWVRGGDTLAVLDSRRRRVVYFDSAGTLVRGESHVADLTSEPPSVGGACVFPGLLGVLGDGTRVTSGWGCMELRGTEGRRPTVLPVELVTADGTLPVGEFTARWAWELGPSSDPRERYAILPFQSGFARAVGEDRIFISEGSEYEIQVFDGRGELVELIREDTVPPPVTGEDRQAYLAERASTSRPHPDGVPFPDRYGAYQALHLAKDGSLWARRASLQGDTLQRWVVFSPNAGGVRRLIVPDLQVDFIRGGRIYGHRSDSLGIQTVVVLDGGV